MLKWTKESVANGFVHTGWLDGEPFAYIAESPLRKSVGYQFRDLKDADLDSQGGKEAPDLETAKQICEALVEMRDQRAN